MMNIANSIKNNNTIPLVTFNLGIAIIGYLGYHVFRWIIHKCPKINKMIKIAKEYLNSKLQSLPPQSLINRVSDLKLSKNKIVMGQGEYIVFHKLPSGEKQALSRETFELAYKILSHYLPNSNMTMEECENRYDLIQAKLKEIDTSLEAVFIPRTLYELIFIRKCIKEDLKYHQICPWLSSTNHNSSLFLSFNNDKQKYQEFLKKKSTDQANRKCWHLCYFIGAVGDNEHFGVKDVAYRLNQLIIKKLSPPVGGYTYREISELVEGKIEFLKDYHKTVSEKVEKLKKGQKIDIISSCSTPGPTTNFGEESNRGSIKPMGIRNDEDAQIIRNAIALECSDIAKKSFLLYRGSCFQKDAPYHWKNDSKAFSLSFGTSLFAGCLYDGGATAFHYMRKNQNDAYAVPISFDQFSDSLFYIPPSNTIAQLFGSGEIFHARTKAWKGFNVKKLGGFNVGENGHVRDHLQSYNLTKQNLITQFFQYKNKAIQLK